LLKQRSLCGLSGTAEAFSIVYVTVFRLFIYLIGCLENDDLENDDLESDDLENDDLESEDLENDDLENDDLENNPRGGGYSIYP